jgi:hypothetical protein
MRKSYITIDTDNAVIRFYLTQARTDKVPEPTVKQLLLDLETLALGLANAHDTTYHVQVVL